MRIHNSTADVLRSMQTVRNKEGENNTPVLAITYSLLIILFHTSVPCNSACPNNNFSFHIVNRNVWNLNSDDKMMENF